MKGTWWDSINYHELHNEAFCTLNFNSKASKTGIRTVYLMLIHVIFIFQVYAKTTLTKYALCFPNNIRIIVKSYEWILWRNESLNDKIYLSTIRNDPKSLNPLHSKPPWMIKRRWKNKHKMINVDWGKSLGWNIVVCT